MHRYAALSFALFILGLTCLAQAQLPLMHAGKGAPGGAAGYQGPGDVVAGAYAWWGLRCYTTAYTGNVADVYAPSDASHTLLTCSAGGTINETIQSLATTCAVSCTVKRLYDQSGNTNCTGPVACDLIQVNEADRPVLTLSCTPNSKYCMTGASGRKMQSLSFVTTPITQAFTITTGAKRTSGTSYSTVLGDTSGNAGLYFGNSANKADVYTAADNLFNQTDGSWHRVIGLFNGASSSGTTDGSTTSLASAGSTGMSTLFNAFDDVGSDPFTGTIVEIGFWHSAFSGGQISSMDSNISTYWGI